MPIMCHFKSDARLIIFVHVGVVSDDEFLSSYKAFYKDARFDKSFNQLVDLRRAESSARSRAALQQVADFVREQFTGAETGAKVAVLAPRDLSYGLARMYKAFSAAAPLDFSVFRSVDDALPWLGVPEDVLDDLEEEKGEGEGEGEEK